MTAWYPDRDHPSLGIFVKRHAIAASRLNKVTVLYARAENDLKQGEFRLEKKESGNFREIILHYGKIKTGFKLLRSFRNWQLLKQHYQFVFKKAIEWCGNPDLIHLHIPWPLGNIARKLSKESKIPYVLTEHWTGYYPEDGRYRGKLLKAVTRKAVANAAVVLPVSAALQQQMIQNGLKGNYQVLGNVVDTALFKPADVPVDHTRFIHVSSLDDNQKNVTGLLRAFAVAKKQEPSMQLIIVGHGSDESAIRRLSNELSLTTRGVEFHGHQEGQKLVDEFNASSALVLNSRFENQPVVILEAFACGLPVISSNVGGIEEVVNEARGILFTSGNQEELVAALLKFHRNKSNYQPKEISKYLKENFSEEVIAKRLDSIYRSILA